MNDEFGKIKNLLENIGVDLELYKINNNSKINGVKDKQLKLNIIDFLKKDDEPFELFSEVNVNIFEEVLIEEVQKLIDDIIPMQKLVYDQKETSIYHDFPKEFINLKGYNDLPYYIPNNKEDMSLGFESRFESGNLKKATQIDTYEYNLVLNNDYNTDKYTQWFFFNVFNIKKNIKYKFNIINLQKVDSLHNSGLKIIAYSKMCAEKENKGWYRDGKRICYFQNNLKKKNGNYYYTLTFTMSFKYDNDYVYLAHSQPYTYTENKIFLDNLIKDKYSSKFLKISPLCQTMNNITCDLLTITNFNDNNYKNKKAIFLSSRIHPGETGASFIIEKIIRELTGPSLTSKMLRDNFIIYIVPMLNIDGVIIGNYRTNLSGNDLNRQWIDPSKKNHPTIYYLKQWIRKVRDEREIILYCDFHGHSRKKNLFIYGCPSKDNLKKELIFGYLMKKNCDVFSINDSVYQIQKDRESCGRIAVFKEFNIVNSFTIEVSFLGADFGKFDCFHFNSYIFNNIAIAFVQSLLDLQDLESTKITEIIKEIEKLDNAENIDINN